MTDLRKLLIEARAWIVANEKHESVCPTRVMGTWGRCRCGFVSIIGRIDAALAEVGEPVAWIQSNHLHNAKNAPFLCRVEPNEREGFIPLYAAPADQWRRVEDGLPPNWKIKVTGPDSDGLLWLTISNTSGRHLSFSAASGDGLLRGAILTELMRDLSALPEGE